MVGELLTLNLLVSGILLAGSPGLGYVILRCVSVSSAEWQGWKRLVGAAFIGGGWWVGNYYIVLPLTPVMTIPQFVEYAAYMGGGLFMLTALVSLTNRLVIARALRHYVHAAPIGANTAVSRENTLSGSAVPYGKAFGELSYKATQLRAPTSKIERTLEEPTVEKGEDVLALLKAENFSPRTSKSFESGEWKAGEQENNPHASRAPLGKLSDLEGFEETLAQLQRDLKDFNENVAGPRTRSKGAKHER